MAKVYSYVRFSTPEQAKGDSYRRQVERIRRYCRENNHVFEDHLTIEDLGKSAYSKANLESGRLGLFLEAVEAGKIENGSILFVESFDRISRADLFTALGVLGKLLDAGITVVAGDREYTAATVRNNQFLLLEPIFTFIRGNEESATKGMRVREAWRHKRDSGLPLTRQMPAWCRLDGGKIVLDEEKAKTVRLLFEMARTMGAKRIARVLNRDKVPPIAWRRRKVAGWQPSYISKILSQPAVIGHFQPCAMKGGKRIPEGPLREDYYPQAVTPAVFHSVRSIMKARANDRGRVAIVRRNLFTGLAYAGNKDAPMHFVNKGNDAAKGGQYLVSDTSVRNYGEAWWAWPYDHFERAFVHYVIGVDFSGVILPGPERKSLEDELQYQNGQLAAVEGKVSRLIALAEGGGDIPQLKARIDALRKEAAQFKEAKADLEARLYVAASGSVALQDTQKDLKRVLDRLQKPDGRDAVRTTLKRFIHRLSLWPFGLGQWKRPSKEERTQGLACLPCFEVQFQQTDMRQIVVVHPTDPTILFWSEYFDETTNSAAVFTNNTKAILALMFPKRKGRSKQRRKP